MKNMFILLILMSISIANAQIKLDGELKKWHKVILTFNGPETSEYAKESPFLDYRLNVTFSNREDRLTIPGFYAADGNSAETSSDSGNKWRVIFRPHLTGEWTYKVSFRKGKDIAVHENPTLGDRLSFDGSSGSFTIAESDKSGRDFRAKGRLEYVGERYLKFAETGEYFIKGGADSPENFLAYASFDGTYCLRTIQREGEAQSVKTKSYEAHINDWKSDDPTWKNGKGKGMIGALNYLASKGMNSVYFLTMNVMGDGNDVWPWINENERTRFDCSKLDQWEIVFDHMEKLGIMMHLVTQETENELLLDIGETKILRKLYYKELIARFGHHLAVTWNLGEENGSADWTPKGQTDQDRKDMSEYLKQQNPYSNFIVLHTHAEDHNQDLYLNPLLGYEYLDGPSLQIADPKSVNIRTKKWIVDSKENGKQWVVNLDEIGHHSTGAKPDSDDPEHNEIRRYVLWGNLMGGGGGVEWYFGYEYADNDLNCEDWRSRDILWDQTRYAVKFFSNNLPFYEMNSADDLTSRKDDYVFAREGNTYVIYQPDNTETELNLIDQSGKYSIQWFDPKSGGSLFEGSINGVNGGEMVKLGNPAKSTEQDWVILLKAL